PYVRRQVKCVVAGRSDFSFAAARVYDVHILLERHGNSSSTKLDIHRIHLCSTNVDNSFPAPPTELKVWKLCKCPHFIKNVAVFAQKLKIFV
ncbi:unnamed protein product, partial [Oikopleura dioica]